MSVSLSVIAGVMLAVLVGLSLGLLGGGGSMLTVPILVYVIGVPAHEAVALSLLVVGATSLAALIPHARAGHVRFRTGALFGAASMTGAYGAGTIAHRVPAAALLVLFAGMMLASAAAMMRGRPRDAADDRRAARPVLALVGLVIGALCGLVGAGGGFAFVPTLILLGRLPTRAAVGTSLLVIAMSSLGGLAGHLEGVHLDGPLAAAVTGAAVAGSVAGGALACRIPPALLRRGFAWLVCTMAAVILAQEIPRALGLEVAWPLALAAAPMALGVLDVLRLATARARPASVAPVSR